VYKALKATKEIMAHKGLLDPPGHKGYKALQGLKEDKGDTGAQG
jgi:hypothetical protein